MLLVSYLNRTQMFTSMSYRVEINIEHQKSIFSELINKVYSIALLSVENGTKIKFFIFDGV